MPRILHLYKSYYSRDFGGVGQVIHQIARATCQQGYQHDVLVLHEGKQLEVVEYEEATVHYVPQDVDLLSTPIGWRLIGRFRRLSRQADLIHYHFPYPVADLLHLLIRPRCPTLVSYHSDIVKQKTALRLYAPLMHHFLGSVSQVVSACDNYLNSSPVLQRYQHKTTVVPYGVEDDGCKPVDAAVLSTMRERFGEQFFFFMGALRYYKGLEFLIEAARKTGLPVVVAGCGGIEAELREKSADVPNLQWAGRVSDEEKAALFQLSKAFMFPSHLRSEAFGISLIEACMYAKPMVSAEIGTGTTFVNQADETGLVVAPADADALAAAMRRLADDPALVERLGINARQRFEQLFTAERMATRYQQLYQQLLARD
ncbi:MAG: glycosyltransferase [Marinobacterium sp.]|nr:glycosyltransferase [Marinobacterium sp.]